LNPSTADEKVDDPTVNKCFSLCKKWGYDGMYLTNLFAFRATNPNVLANTDIDPIGDKNDYYIRTYAQKSRCIVVGLGNRGNLSQRDEEVINLLRKINKPIYCLGLNINGSPRHPLYVPNETKRKEYISSIISCMPITSIKKVRNLAGKRVLVRVDFNVPMEKKKVVDDMRIRAGLPTIKFLVEKGAKVILMTHLGRPDGVAVKELRVDPVVNRLGELLGKNVLKLETGDWRLSDKKKIALLTTLDDMNNGDVAMMENIRFSPDEKKNTGRLSEELANLADIFVLDGFAVAHRAEASVVGPATFLPSYSGLLLDQELKGLSKVMDKPKKPFVVVLGGAKIETKIPVMKNLLPKAEYILVGGGILNTYLYAKGYKVGGSLIDKDFLKEALAYCSKRKVILPVDVVVGDKEGKKFHVVNITKQPSTIINKQSAIYDIGPKTIRLFSTYIKSAQTLVWNGAMGYFEQKPYDVGTLSIARLVASRSKGKAFGVIGGGETVQAMEMVGMSEYVDLVSAGGGAMLEYLGGKKLPGVRALEKTKNKE